MLFPEFVTSPALLVICAVLGYLLGSIPFGIVIARGMGLGDLREIGSGNIGATNVLRTGSKLGAFLTLVLDAGKAGFAVLIARAVVGEDAAQIAGFAAFFGHCYPIWLKFNGGKGVATFFGLLFALAWPLGLIVGAIWLITAAVSRYSSLAALLSSATFPVFAMILPQSELFLLGIALCFLIWWRHKSNIRRLFTRTESKIGKTK